MKLADFEESKANSLEKPANLLSLAIIPPHPKNFSD